MNLQVLLFMLRLNLVNSFLVNCLVKVTVSYECTITCNWGDKIAWQHYHDKGIVPIDLFNEIYWDGVEGVLDKSPDMFSIWAMKQVSGFFGTTIFYIISMVSRLMHFPTVKAIPNEPLMLFPVGTLPVPPPSPLPSTGWWNGLLLNALTPNSLFFSQRTYTHAAINWCQVFVLLAHVTMTWPVLLVS